MKLIILVIILIAPISLFSINYFLTKSKAVKFRKVRLFVIATIFTYALIVGNSIRNDVIADDRLQQFDLDKNDNFDIQERSLPGYQEAERNVVNDTGRTFAPSTAIPFSIIWVTISYIAFKLLLITLMLIRRLINKSNF